MLGVGFTFIMPLGVEIQTLEYIIYTVLCLGCFVCYLCMYICAELRIELRASLLLLCRYSFH